MIRPQRIKLTINGKSTSLETLPYRSLLELLREDLRLTGAKDACGGEGECGACTVLLDGRPVNACLVLACQADGCEVTTIEGLAGERGLHIVQQAFIDTGAVQCGYCTPGAVLSVKALLDVIPDPDDDEIREALSGNLCRCTGYDAMFKAVKLAAGERRHDC